MGDVIRGDYCVQRETEPICTGLVFTNNHLVLCCGQFYWWGKQRYPGKLVTFSCYEPEVVLF
jgi:hypothetical protein